MISPARRLDSVEISLIRQINALATSETINLGIGEPNVEPDTELREMAARAAADGSWHYTPNAGTRSLRQRIAESLDSSIDPATQVCVTAGTEEGLFAIMQAFVQPGDEVLLPDPGFVSYATLVRLAGGSVLSYPLEPLSWRLDAAEVISRMTTATRMVVINSPSNPLGCVATEEALRRIALAAEQRGALVVSDEVYREIYYDERPPSMQGMGRNVVVVNGMSKSHSMTGLRIGWAIASEELMIPIVKAHQYITTCASSFSQSLAEAVFESSEWNRRWLDAVRKQFRVQRDAAVGAIEKELEVKIEAPQGAFYAFVPVPSCDSLSLARSLATEASVLAIPGVAFGGNGEGFLRLSFAVAPELVLRGIERIGRYLRARSL